MQYDFAISSCLQCRLACNARNLLLNIQALIACMIYSYSSCDQQTMLTKFMNWCSNCAMDSFCPVSSYVLRDYVIGFLDHGIHACCMKMNTVRLVQFSVIARMVTQSCYTDFISNLFSFRLKSSFIYKIEDRVCVISILVFVQ